MVVHELGQDEKDSFVKIKNCTPFHIHAEHQLLHTPTYTFNNNFASLYSTKYILVTNLAQHLSLPEQQLIKSLYIIILAANEVEEYLL